MTKDKIKLKDLAEDLKIPRQELLGTAREMNLAVRSVQGSVTPEEADKLRRHYEKIRQADKDQKQVIVRHRRNAAPADGAGAKPAPRERAADGGKPQLTAAMTQLAELGLDIPVCGLAKSDEEVFVPWDDTPVVLPSGSPSLYLIKQVRDESHRFAITFHRELRTKAQGVSVLDEVEGVGPKRKRAIMRHFGSFKRLRAASVDDIAEVKGVPQAVAEEIYKTLRAWEQESSAEIEA